jgi:hypothetical protein
MPHEMTECEDVETVYSGLQTPTFASYNPVPANIAIEEKVVHITPCWSSFGGQYLYYVSYV